MQTREKINELVQKIKELENELESELVKKQEEFFCIIGKQIEFKEEILQEQKRHIENVFYYIATAPILHLLTAPFIYAIIIPALLLDILVSLYQMICFPVYKIEKVKRGEYLIIDRHHLHYLNIIEKINCIYCSYFNGLIAYIGEIAARTEQYWCPIKHAQKMKFIHSKYQNFFDYGDSVEFRQNLQMLRETLLEIKTKETLT